MAQGRAGRHHEEEGRGQRGGVALSYCPSADDYYFNAYYYGDTPNKGKSNYNDFLIPSADGPPEPLFNDVWSVDKDGLRVTPLFCNHENNLVHLIKQADVVLGCVAWLTSFPVLDALAKKRASIVVQKEDFLRPDANSPFNSKTKLRTKYEKIGGLDRYDVEETARLSSGGDPTLQGVRCMGHHNKEKNFTAPRMHNKFFVFCKVETVKDISAPNCEREQIVPYAVWTGSYNPTFNSTNSLENVVVIKNERIAAAYKRVWGDIVALSEPLDWEADWCAPEWRIGT